MSFRPELGHSPEKLVDRARFERMLSPSLVAISTGFPGDPVYARRLARRCRALILVDRNKHAFDGLWPSERLILIPGNIFDWLDRLIVDVVWVDLMCAISRPQLEKIEDVAETGRAMLTVSTERRTSHLYKTVDPKNEWGWHLANTYKRARGVWFNTFVYDTRRPS